MKAHLLLATLLVRRLLPPWSWVALPLLLWGAGLRLDLGPGVLGEAGGDLGQAFAAQGRWSAFLLLVVPLLVSRSAVAGALWRRGWCRWLGVLSLRRGVLAVHLVGATLLALALALALAAGVQALTSTEAAHATHLRSLTSERQLFAVAGARQRLPLGDDLPHPAQLWIRPTLAPGADPGAPLDARVLQDSEALDAPVRWDPGARRLEVELPATAGLLELELERPAASGLVLLRSGAVSLVAPEPPGASVAAARVALRVGLWLGPLLLLALGLGAWLRPPLAALVALALGLWRFPGSDLALTLGRLGRGLAPGPGAPEGILPLLAALALAGILVRLSFEKEDGLP